MSYYDKQLDTLKDLIGSNYADLKRKLEYMPEDEYHALRNGLPTVIGHAQDIHQEIIEIERDRTTDFDAMIRLAKKRFNEIDIQILEALDDDGEGYSYRYAGIQSHIIDNGYEAPSGAQLRKRTHRLMRLGLIRHMKGLFDEDGFVAGSGFTINQRRLGIVQAIVSSYRSGEKQLAADL